MDLTQLANLGEFIGGIAVIGSLIFVGWQVRSNAKAIRQSSTHAAIETWAGMNENFARDRDLALLVEKVFHKSPVEDFDEHQAARVGALLRATLMRLEAEFFLFESGVMDGELWRKHVAAARTMVGSPIGLQWWGDQKVVGLDMYTERFLAALGDPT